MAPSHLVGFDLIFVFYFGIAFCYLKFKFWINRKVVAIREKGNSSEKSLIFLSINTEDIQKKRIQSARIFHALLYPDRELLVIPKVYTCNNSWKIVIFHGSKPLILCYLPIFSKNFKSYFCYGEIIGYCWESERLNQIGSLWWIKLHSLEGQDDLLTHCAKNLLCPWSIVGCTTRTYPGGYWCDQSIEEETRRRWTALLRSYSKYFDWSIVWFVLQSKISKGNLDGVADCIWKREMRYR